MIHTAKTFDVVNKAEIDVFLELSCFFHDPADVGNLISRSSAFSKTSLNVRKFTVHVLLKPASEVRAAAGKSYPASEASGSWEDAYASIYNICFSLSDLLCMTDSRSNPITTNDPVLFLFMPK